MRGTLERLATPRAPRIRIIPAHAGNSWPRAAQAHVGSGSSPRMRGTLSRPSAASSSDHPRACGELTLALYKQHAPKRRIIPAHAGNSLLKLHGQAGSPSTDHPRACGELSSTKPTAASSRIHGSSPRMRGTQLPGLQIGSSTGVADHPRACGELMRRCTTLETEPIQFRIIPAHAGNSYRDGCGTTYFMPPQTDHPRACGELELADRPTVMLDPGSSPRMRGTRRTLAFASPRMRGTHARQASSTGSSPRMRGTPQRDLAQGDWIIHRIIPAHAGNSCR